MDTEEQPITYMDPVRLGRITMIVAAASVIVLLMLSGGYDPRVDFTANLYYLLTLYRGQWFCQTTPGDFYAAPVTECTDVVIYTKYLILLCFMVATYGFLMFRSLAPNPMPYFARLFYSIIAIFKRAQETVDSYYEKIEEKDRTKTDTKE